MGRNAAWLSEKQIEVLDWIRAGCPTRGVEEDYGRRITARALQRRGLVDIRGNGESWTASITEAGLAWKATHPEATQGDAQVDELIRDVVAADGRLELPKGDDTVRTYKELVRMSDHRPSRPRGWRLEVRTTGPWDDPRREVVLVRHFEDLVDALPVPVPGRVTRYHPAVKAFLGDRDRQWVSKEHVDRAAHILQAIVEEAPRRGLGVLNAEQAKNVAGDSYHVRAAERCRLALRSPAGVYGIRLKEVSAPSDEMVDPRRRYQRRTRAAWLDARNTEFIGTGILELIIDGPGTGYSGDRHRDAKTIPLEAKLPRVFRMIEIHRLQAEWRDQEREREATDRRRQWEAAMVDARARYDEQARWDAFDRSSRAWRAVTDGRGFLAAARRAIDGDPGAARHGLVAHLDFAERRLDELDPICDLELLVPEVPEPKPDDLRPYLDGWSPHGPDASAR